MSPRHRSELGLVLVTVIWGLTFPAIRTAMTTGASPMSFVAVRFAIASLVLLPFALPGIRQHGPAILRPGLLLGATLGGGYAMQTIGLTTTTASNSGFLTGTSVVMVPFLDALVRKARLRPSAIAGGALALFGIYLLSGLGDWREVLSGRPGDLWTLAGAASYAFYVVLLQDELPRFEHRALLFTQLAIVAVAAAVIAPLTEVPVLRPEPKVVGAIVFCALFATIGTGLLHQRSQGGTTPARAALIFALEPIFAAAFSALLLAEQLAPSALFGGGLIVIGVLASDLGPALGRPPDPGSPTP